MAGTFLQSSRVMALLMFIVTMAASADESDKAKLNCREPLASGPAAVRDVLGTLYRADPSAEQLEKAAKQLGSLVSEATFCRSYAQSGELGRDRGLALEWVSLFQWFNRLADYVDMNARGLDRGNWKDEYRDFAEVYEFEA